MENHKRQQVTAGLVLIVLGFGLFALQRAEGLGWTAIFFVVGAAFLTAYFYRKEYGFLIPGCIMLGLGFGTVFHQWSLACLGLGFVAIAVIQFAYQRRLQWWPLIPGGVLILIDTPDREKLLRFLSDYWPLILVVIGALILIGAFIRPNPGRGTR